MLQFAKTLITESQKWLESGLIDQTQRKLILDQYTHVLQSPTLFKRLPLYLSFLFFTCALLLLVAYNWEQVDPGIKLSISFFLLFGAQISALMIWNTHRPIAEGLVYLTCLLSGIVIWLTAQVFHLHNHFPNGILLWSFCFLPALYVSPTKPLRLSLLFLLILHPLMEFNHWEPAKWNPLNLFSLGICLGLLVQKKMLTHFEYKTLCLAFALWILQGSQFFWARETQAIAVYQLYFFAFLSLSLAFCLDTKIEGLYLKHRNTLIKVLTLFVIFCTTEWGLEILLMHRYVHFDEQKLLILLFSCLVFVGLQWILAPKLLMRKSIYLPQLLLLSIGFLASQSLIDASNHTLHLARLCGIGLCLFLMRRGLLQNDATFYFCGIFGVIGIGLSYYLSHNINYLEASLCFFAGSLILYGAWRYFESKGRP